MPMPMKTMVCAPLVLAAALACAPVWGQGGQPGHDSEGRQSAHTPTLRERYEALQPALAASPFGRPLVVHAGGSPSRPSGDVYAIVDHPFERVGPALQGTSRWCEMLMLQFNIKRCAPNGQPPNETLQVSVGRKADQPVKDAFVLQFDYDVLAARPDYLAVRMNAVEGPIGTRDYRLAVESVPVDGARSFIHLSYAYTTGFAARMATQAYLATFGRQKIGFSIVGHTSAGRPIYVKGIQGVAERNAMRYFLGIDAYLDALHLPRDRQVEKRLREWFAETERYPQQLHEMELDDYLAMKRREM